LDLLFWITRIPVGHYADLLVGPSLEISSLRARLNKPGVPKSVAICQRPSKVSKSRFLGRFGSDELLSAPQICEERGGVEALFSPEGIVSAEVEEALAYMLQRNNVSGFKNFSCQRGKSNVSEYLQRVIWKIISEGRLCMSAMRSNCGDGYTEVPGAFRTWKLIEDGGPGPRGNVGGLQHRAFC
jgi:hypothetical protein